MTQTNNMSLTIFIPAYNEEANLEATVTQVTEQLQGVVSDYEFVILNDCSTDRTAEVAEKLKSTYPDKIRVYHNEKNQGLGSNFRRGIELASKEYFIFVPGDNELNPESVRFIAKHVGQADLIISYPENVYFRPYFRQILSTTFTAMLNTISGFHLGYYNGAILVRTSLLRTIDFDTNGFAFQAEYLIKLLKAGHSFIQIPFKLNYTSKRLTALKPKNVASVVYTVTRLFGTYRVKPIITGKDTASLK